MTTEHAAVRAIAVSPDLAFARELGAALETTGATVEVHAAIEDVSQGASLWVIHLADDRADRAARAHDRCPIIAVAPRAGLATVVELMHASERVVGVMIAEDFDPARLAALAGRVLASDPFGLAGLMAPGTKIHERTLDDYRGKTACISAITRFAEHNKSARRRRDQIEQCLDEMLMNALYDAPIGEGGAPLFADVPARERVRLRSTQSVTVQYAADSTKLAVSVRDAFGALARTTVLRFLHKGIHSQRPVDRRAGGAGLGLYLMLNAASEVYFNVLPGIATEAICTFDLEGTPRLEQFGYLALRDTTNRRPTPPARVRPARGSIAGPIFAGLTVLGAAAALLYPVVFAEAPPAVVELDSKPTGAAVVVDGKAVGSAPVSLTLPPGATVSVAFERPGYRAVATQVQVPPAGERRELVQPLQQADDQVQVHFVSNPPGAQVRRSGQPETADRIYTPADVFVAADQVQSFTLTMPKHVPLIIEPFTPARGLRRLERGGDLPAGATIRIEATLGGAISVADAPHCQAIALPAECVLAPGAYTVEWAADHAKVAHPVVVTDKDAVDRFELGYVEAPPGKKLQPGDATRIVLEAGARTVTVSDGGGATHRAKVTVKAGGTVVAQ